MSTSLVSRKQKSWIASSFLPLKRIPDGQKKRFKHQRDWEENYKWISKRIFNYLGIEDLVQSENLRAIKD